ncbi:hypothetical protein B0A49_02958 [Cryomyces minteri]|uniref:Uncharacterized protein n=1 Tax=Cryomyces minteri TaxID=331657 RepID=A0A4U0XE64_9PEZI|nr:hypothetical protein B0A49_08170 [Cryomyces minteri]TKA75174.1 hypothetical protein B0A49_02958 [Cryomyces minteri]
MPYPTIEIGLVYGILVTEQRFRIGHERHLMRLKAAVLATKVAGGTLPPEVTFVTADILSELLWEERRWQRRRVWKPYRFWNRFEKLKSEGSLGSLMEPLRIVLGPHIGNVAENWVHIGMKKYVDVDGSPRSVPPIILKSNEILDATITCTTRETLGGASLSMYTERRPKYLRRYGRRSKWAPPYTKFQQWIACDGIEDALGEWDRETIAACVKAFGWTLVASEGKDATQPTFKLHQSIDR